MKNIILSISIALLLISCKEETKDKLKEAKEALSLEMKNAVDSVKTKAETALDSVKTKAKSDLDKFSNRLQIVLPYQHQQDLHSN